MDRSNDAPMRALLSALLLLLLFLLSACGYTHPHAKLTEQNTETARETVSIFIDMWNNNTTELGFQAEIRRELFHWLKKSPRIIIAHDREQADYTLSGAVESAHFPGLSYGAWDRAVELRARIRYSYAVTRRHDGAVLLQEKNQIRHEPFTASESAAATETNKRAALRRISDGIGETIYIQLGHLLARER